MDEKYIVEVEDDELVTTQDEIRALESNLKFCSSVIADLQKSQEELTRRLIFLERENEELKEGFKWLVNNINKVTFVDPPTPFPFDPDKYGGNNSFFKKK